MTHEQNHHCSRKKHFAFKNLTVPASLNKELWISKLLQISRSLETHEINPLEQGVRSHWLYNEWSVIYYFLYYWVGGRFNSNIMQFGVLSNFNRHFILHFLKKSASYTNSSWWFRSVLDDLRRTQLVEIFITLLNGFILYFGFQKHNYCSMHLFIPFQFPWEDFSS